MYTPWKEAEKEKANMPSMARPGPMEAPRHQQAPTGCTAEIHIPRASQYPILVSPLWFLTNPQRFPGPCPRLRDACLMHRTLLGYARPPCLTCLEQGPTGGRQTQLSSYTQVGTYGSWKFSAESRSPSSTEGQSSH